MKLVIRREGTAFPVYDETTGERVGNYIEASLVVSADDPRRARVRLVLDTDHPDTTSICNNVESLRFDFDIPWQNDTEEGFQIETWAVHGNSRQEYAHGRAHLWDFFADENVQVIK